mgnify:CR=1 FL=1|tara:strand:+ start:870 stop:1358 length:489 start_codon:yes stop_codon:yes gene_type:complete
MVKNLNKNFVFDLIIFFSIFFIDRFSKLYVIFHYEKLKNPEIYLSKFFNIYLIWNEGIAFGLFSFEDKFYYNIFTVLIILIITIILWIITRSKGLDKFGFIFILGGATGNVFDRVYYSSVPDFIDIHYNNFHWFIFNVADIFISLGVLLLIYSELILKKNYE